MYVIVKNKDNRSADKAEISCGVRSANPTERRLAKEAGKKIANEGGAVKSMREALVKAHRERRMDNVKDIHSFIANNPKYK